MKILVVSHADCMDLLTTYHIINGINGGLINLNKLTCAGNLGFLASNPPYSSWQVDTYNKITFKYVVNIHLLDAMIHLVAGCCTDHSIDEPVVFINITGSYNLPESSQLCRNNLFEDKKQVFHFHHSSTNKLYRVLEDMDNLFTATISHALNNTYPFIYASNNYDPFNFQETLNFVNDSKYLR